MLKLERPLCCLDVETTGLDPQKDRIVTLAIVQIHTDGTRVPFSWMFNPGVEMSQENIAIHGITNEVVASCPPFADKAQEVAKAIAGGDLAGFNILGFDIQILWEEFNRCGIVLDTASRAIVDAGVIMKRLEERSCEAALMFYCGRKHEGAHGAMADVKATLEVLEAQLAGRGQFLPQEMRRSPETFDKWLIDQWERYVPLSKMSVQQLSDFCAIDKDGGRRMDLAGTIVRDKNGVYRYTHKKVRGVAVADDMTYAGWMLRSDFSVETHRCIRAVLDEIQREQEEQERAEDEAAEEEQVGQKPLF